jgi:hypothetical protein
MAPDRSLKIAAAQAAFVMFKNEFVNPILDSDSADPMNLHVTFEGVGGTLFEGSIGETAGTELEMFSREKAFISFQTQMRIFDVQKDYEHLLPQLELLLPKDKLDLLKPKGLFQRAGKLHAGGIYSKGHAGIGVSGEGNNFDCRAASWLDTKFQECLAQPRLEAA